MTILLIFTCALGVLSCALARNVTASVWAFIAMLGAIGRLF